MQISAIVDRLSRLGLSEGQPVPVRERILLANRVAGVLVAIVIIGVATNLDPASRPLLSGFGLLGVVAVAVPLLNRFHRTTASRLVLALSPPVVFLAPLVWAGGLDIGQLLAVPYALLAMSLLPLILFHRPIEAPAWWTGVGYCGLVLFLHDRLLLSGLPQANLAPVEGMFADLKLAALLLWLLLVASAEFLVSADRRTGKE